MTKDEPESAGEPDIHILLNNAEKLFDEGQLHKALELYNRIDAEVHQAKGEAYDKLGEYSAAITEYREAIRLEPKEWWYYLWLGHAYVSNGQLNKALEAYTESRKLNPTGSSVLYSLAECQKDLGMHQETLETLRAYVALDPSYSEQLVHDVKFKHIWTNDK